MTQQSLPRPTIDQLLGRIISLEARVKSLEGRPVPTQTSGGLVADDRDLDSQYGDPEVRFDPPKWTQAGKQSFAGRRFSQCPIDYLDALASFLEWAGQKADEKGEVTSAGKLVGPFKRKDAARARGWANRHEKGWGSRPVAAQEPEEWVPEREEGSEMRDLDAMFPDPEDAF